jgi:anti-anti-sigma factor
MPINEWSDTILIAEMTDEPIFSEDVEVLERHIDGAPSEGAPDVIVDMKNVSYLNSSNIAQLLRLRKKLIAQHRRLRICSVRDSTWSVLMTAGLDQIFDFTEDVSTSLASLQIGDG